MGEPKPVNFRHELKYLISSAEVTMLRTRLSGLISLDAHAKNGHYTIRSLYFDDYDDRCLLENENGTDPREKFRIRIYNGSADRISLECKRKERGMTHKTSCPLTREQTELLMAGKIVPNVADQPPLLQKLTAQMMTRRLHPVVIVEYERIPFVYKNGNVRITLDTNLVSSSDVSQFLRERIPHQAGHAAGTAASGGQIRRLSAGLPVPESSTVRLKTDGIFQVRTVQKIYKIRRES